MNKKPTTGLKPGTPAPASGEYQIRGTRGGHGPERTSDINKPLPPTPHPGQTYDLVRRAKNGAGQGKG
jgi:hypothetical protein